LKALSVNRKAFTKTVAASSLPVGRHLCRPLQSDSTQGCARYWQAFQPAATVVRASPGNSGLDLSIRDLLKNLLLCRKRLR